MADDEVLTLAFDLSALRRLADPAAAFHDAEAWSEAVGIVSEKPAHVVSKFARDHALQQDFEPDPAPVPEMLAHVREHYGDVRCVYVGTAEGHREIAASVEWEYIDVTEAADAAGWSVTEAPATESTRTETSTDDWP